MNWVKRETVIYTLDELPFDSEGKIELVDPSKVRVQVPCYIHPYDFGSWCYLQRKKTNLNQTSTDADSIVMVIENSLRRKRKAFVESFLEYLQMQVKLGKSSDTLSIRISSIQSFIQWCNEHYKAGLDSQADYVGATKQYSDFLIHKVRANGYNSNTANAMQKMVIQVGKDIFSDPYAKLFSGIRKIKKSASAVNRTERPCDELADKTIRLYNDVFNQLSDFVLENKKFPTSIKLEHGDFTFFPNNIPFAGKLNIPTKKGLKLRFKAYDYEHGRIRTLQEIIAEIKPSNYSKIGYANAIRKSALLKIKAANHDKFHHRRLYAASLAQLTFTMMFSVNTGMNLGLIASLLWDDGKFDLKNDVQGFKTIKYRAGGKEVSFMISRTFLRHFRKFLLLRQYILNGIGKPKFENLFFTIENKTPRKIKMDFSRRLHRRLKSAFGYQDIVTTRMWRAYKSDWLVRNTDVATASMILQNTPETVLKHYIEGSESQAQEELTVFLKKYNDKLIPLKKEKTISTSIGQCVETHKPQSLLNVVIKADCEKPEGCLFCDNYRVHIDEKDCRKLVSCKYVIETSRVAAHDDNHFHNLFDPIITQIDWLLSQLKKPDFLSENIVNHVIKEVYELELLDEYWLRKLQLLEDLEVI